MEPRELDPHLHPEFGVEIAEGLVKQEQLRLAHDRAADRDALPLAAGKLARLTAKQFSDAQYFRRAAHAPRDVGPVVPGHPQAEAEILFDRHVRIERVGLEHHGDAAVGRLDIIDDFAADRHLALGDCFEPGDHAKQRRFPAARRADEDDKFGVGNIKVGTVDDLVGAEALDHFF